MLAALADTAPGLVAGFSNLTCQVISTTAVLDTHNLRLGLRGDHTGPYLGIAPTGKVIEVLATLVVNRREAKPHLSFDRLEVLRQIGAVNLPEHGQ